VFASRDDLDDIAPIWYVAMAVLEALSFVCMWELLRVCMQTRKWFAVVTSHLASNAYSKVVPGGSATSAALQYSMLTHAGLSSASIGTGLAASGLLNVIVLAAMPIFAIPAILGGAPVHP
jgi:uncharacterized membrane protein YbhN (UPF0104 family)